VRNESETDRLKGWKADRQADSGESDRDNKDDEESVRAKKADKADKLTDRLIS
jgi:hypothetical protein